MFNESVHRIFRIKSGREGGGGGCGDVTPNIYVRYSRWLHGMDDGKLPRDPKIGEVERDCGLVGGNSWGDIEGNEVN